MSSLLDVGTSTGAVRLVIDDEYFDVAQRIISGARTRCLASLFIVDLKTGTLDADVKVLQLLRRLHETHWRGVDVKLLIGGSRRNILIAETAEIARYMALDLGIPSRWLTSRDVRGSHAKLVVADDVVLVGSHNWSASAFTNQTQDSLYVESAALAAHLSSFFRRQWERAS